MTRLKRTLERYRQSSTFLPGVIIGFCLGFVLHAVIPSLVDLWQSGPDDPVNADIGENIERVPTDTTELENVDDLLEDERENWADSVPIDRTGLDPERPVVARDPALSGSGLVIPVDGVGREDLYDSFDDGRSGGRVHNALDIPASEGTPVLAATGGEVLRLFTSDLGGLTLYQRGDDGLIYYYAHLQDYAPGVTEGMRIEPGDVIAYVGNTGNAGPDNYHLHFAIWIPDDSTSFWDGVAVNPYPLLGNAAGR